MPATSSRTIFFVLAAVAAGCRPSSPNTSPVAPERAASTPVSAEAPAKGPQDFAQGTPMPEAEEAAGALADAQGSASERDRSVNRQGIGTAYGEQRFSSITTVPFERGSQSPDVTLALYYNDSDGIRTLARGTRSFRRSRGAQQSSDGTFVLRVVDEHGRELFGADVAGRRYALGQTGQRYQIGVENHSGSRFEVVASVDGLDVIDGGAARVDKRGYVLEPHSSLMLDGWRTSDDTVAAFRFSSMQDSYAERTGQGRNIGVIGAAFFHEEGAAPWQELRRRHVAQPFSDRYAPPPPPR